MRLFYLIMTSSLHDKLWRFLRQAIWHFFGNPASDIALLLRRYPTLVRVQDEGRWCEI